MQWGLLCERALDRARKHDSIIDELLKYGVGNAGSKGWKTPNNYTYYIKGEDPARAF
jgi:hypothetical protein